MFAPRLIKRIMVGIIGGTVVLIGVVMIVTPGPAVVVIPAGLAILATEFAWARLWLKRAKRLIARKKNNAPSEQAAPDNGTSSP